MSPERNTPRDAAAHTAPAQPPASPRRPGYLPFAWAALGLALLFVGFLLGQRAPHAPGGGSPAPESAEKPEPAQSAEKGVIQFEADYRDGQVDINGKRLPIEMFLGQMFMRNSQGAAPAP